MPVHQLMIVCYMGVHWGSFFVLKNSLNLVTSSDTSVSDALITTGLLCDSICFKLKRLEQQRAKTNSIHLFGNDRVNWPQCGGHWSLCFRQAIGLLPIMTTYSPRRATENTLTFILSSPYCLSCPYYHCLQSYWMRFWLFLCTSECSSNRTHSRQSQLGERVPFRDEVDPLS